MESYTDMLATVPVTTGCGHNHSTILIVCECARLITLTSPSKPWCNLLTTQTQGCSGGASSPADTYQCQTTGK